MRNILVVGGTRFFGRKLVEKLIANKDRVTVASHNFSKTSFGPEVNRLEIEREVPESLEILKNQAPFDLVYDQICYSPSAAHFLQNALEGRAKKLVHTSTQSVYISDEQQREENFDPYKYPVKLGLRSEFGYGEGKRLAEAVYFQKTKFPVTAVRFPLVLGLDDYTGRLDFHVQRIVNNQPIVAEEPESATSLISADEAASFLYWVGLQDFSGPINACSSGKISLLDLIDMIGSLAKRNPVVSKIGEDSAASPYAQRASRYLSTELAQSLGFHFSNLRDWLKPLLEERVRALT